MKKIEDTLKEMWDNETVKDLAIISGVTIVEYVAENVLFRQISSKYHNFARAITDVGSNTVSYYAGKSRGEKINQTQNQNGTP
jgi:hypothetical protein